MRGASFGALRIAQRVAHGRTSTPIATAVRKITFTSPGYTDVWRQKPTYRPDGTNWNNDYCFKKSSGLWPEAAPNTSLTGKPRRQLGHYPHLGPPIVPICGHHTPNKDNGWLMIDDNEFTPLPWQDESDITLLQIAKIWLWGPGFLWACRRCFAA